MEGLEEYRKSEAEAARSQDLLRLLPTGRQSVLDIGARDGHFSRLLTNHFEQVTALDLEEPKFVIPRVTTIAGDVTRLPFPDSAFDCVFCAEVLEHVADVERACRELARVTRHELVIGVPFKQDIRCGRTTCGHCGRTNPPWGHINSFDEARLAALFPTMRLVATSFVGSTREVTNPFSAFLMDLAGNPWGTYEQHEPCIHCGGRLEPRTTRGMLQRVSAAVAGRVTRLQTRLTRPRGNWIHAVFAR